MKKIILMSLVALFTLNMSSFAGEKEKAKKPTPASRAEALAKELGLTDVQKGQIVKVFVAQDEEAKQFKAEKEAIKDPASPEAKELKKKMNKAQKKHDAELKEIMGEEKFAKFLEKRAAKKKQNPKTEKPSAATSVGDNY